MTHVPKLIIPPPPLSRIAAAKQQGLLKRGGEPNAHPAVSRTSSELIRGGGEGRITFRVSLCGPCMAALVAQRGDTAYMQRMVLKRRRGTHSLQA